MTEGAILPLLIKFTLPILAGTAFQLLYNTVDTIVVGRFVGTSALAAIGSTTMICNTMVKFFQGISIGAGVVISYYFGAKDDVNLHKAIQTTMSIALILSAAITAIGFFGTDSMLRFMHSPADVFPEASLYLHIYFAGVSGLLIYNMGSAILRSVGDSRRPLYFLIFTSFLNIILDLVFVLGFKTGIAGAGIATIISQFISAILVMKVLCLTKENYRYTPIEFTLEGGICSDIMRKGLPVGLQQGIIQFSNIFVQSYINGFGSAAMAGWGCFSKIDQYCFLPIQSIGQATTTFVSQNRGAKKFDRVGKGVRIAFCTAFGIGATMSAIIWIYAPFVSGLFSTDENVIYYGTLIIRVCITLASITTCNQVFSGAVRGLGNSTTPMMITLTSHVFIRQIYLFIISRVLPGNLRAIAAGYPLGWIITSCAITAYYLHYKKLVQGDGSVSR